MGEADKQPLISVIVPVYKVEPYLRDCVDSILAQTYRNLEIILVDDGSPDNCPAICDEYAEKDSRVRVIHRENGGLSDARNAGLSVCSGEYLMFVDSDDMLTLTSVNILYTLAVECQAQLVIGDYVRFDNEPEIPVINASSDVKTLNNTEAMAEMFQKGCASWARLYRTSVHKNTLFPKGEINEDEAIVLPLLENCEKVVVTKQVVYLYRCRPESITTASFSPKKLAWYRHCKANLEWIQSHHPELTDLAAARYRSSILWSLTEMALAEGAYKNETKTLCEELRAEKKAFRKIPYQYATDRVRAFVLTYLPFSWYRALIRLKRKS